MAPFKLRLRMGGSRSSSQEHDSDRQVNEALIPNNQSAKVRAASSTTIDSSTDCNSLGSLGTNECKQLLPNNSTMDYISWTSLQDIGNGGGGSFNHSAAALTTPPQLYDYELEEVGRKTTQSHAHAHAHAHATTAANALALNEHRHTPATAIAHTAAAGGSTGTTRKHRHNLDSQNDGSLELQTLQCTNNMSNEFNENELQQSISGSSSSNTNCNNSNNDHELHNDVNNAKADNHVDDEKNRNDDNDVGNVDDDGGHGDDGNDIDDDDDDDVSNERSDHAGRSSSKETIDVAAAAAATTPTSLTEQLLLVENCEDDDCHCTEYSEGGSGDECNDERCSSNCSCNKACGTTYDGNYMEGGYDGSGEQHMMMDGDEMWGAQQHGGHYGEHESCLTQEILSHKSSKEIYKDLAKQWGITCKMSDGCRCMECQSHYFDCEFDDNDHQKTDGGLGAGTPMFLSEVMHGSACTIL